MKQVFTLTKFDGINNVSSIEDISNTQAASSYDVNLGASSINNGGILTVMGSFDVIGASEGVANANIQPGYGMFYFENDYAILASANTFNTTKVMTPRYYYILYNETGSYEITLYQHGSSTVKYETEAPVLSSGAKPMFYVTKDSIRVYDSNLANNTSNKWWLGFIKITQSNATSNNYFTRSGWYWADFDISKPSNEGIIGDTAGSNTGQVSLNPTSGGVDSGTWNGNYEFYYSYIYDGEQESALTKFDTQLSFTNQSLTIDTIFPYSVTDYSLFNPRITGYRIYYDENHINKFDINRYLLLEVDLEKGKRKTTVVDFVKDAVGDDSATDSDGENLKSGNTVFNDPLTFQNYKSLNGYDGDSHLTSRFRTSVVVNRRCYIGGLFKNGTYYGDRMLKSVVDKYDIFPEDNFIDINTDDGDDIIKLEQFADRILQFKKNTLYVINASQQYEFLEGTYPHYGIKYPSQSCETPFGIFWVSEGVFYLFDGKRINNLSALKFKLDMPDSNIPSVAYDAKFNRVICLRECYSASDDADNHHSVIIYSLESKSFSFGYKRAYLNSDNDCNRTNLVYNKFEDVMYYSANAKLTKWDDTSESLDYNIELKMTDCGKKNIRKKIHKIYVTHKNSDNYVRLKYKIIDVDGISGSWTTVDSSSDSMTLPNSTTLALTGFTIKRKDVLAIQVGFEKLTSAVPYDFEIHDVTFLYTTKEVK